MAWFDARGSPASATMFLYSGFKRSAQSAGGFGTILAQDAWLPVLRTLGSRFWAGGRLLVSRAGQAFDADGRLVDERTRAQLAQFLAAYRDSIRR